MSRQSTLSAPNNKSKPRPLRPRNHNMVIDWFFSEEKDKGSGLNPETGKIATWFHGKTLFLLMLFAEFILFFYFLFLFVCNHTVIPAIWGPSGGRPPLLKEYILLSLFLD